MDEREVRELLTNAADAVVAPADLPERAERRYQRRRARGRVVVLAVVVALIGSGVAAASLVDRDRSPTVSHRGPAPRTLGLVDPNSLVSLAFVDATTGYAVEAQGARYVLVKTVDGGHSFSSVAYMPPSAAHLGIGDSSKQGTELIAWGGRDLYVGFFIGDGFGWTKALPGPIGAVAVSSHRIWASVVCPSATPCPARVVTSDGNVFHWHDTSLRPAGIGALAIVATSKETAYVVEHAAPSIWEVASTTDGGAHWSHEPTPCVYNVAGGLVMGGPPRLAVGQDGKSFMLVCSDGAVAHAYTSSDASTWSPVAPLPPGQVLAMAAIGNSQFAVGLGGSWTKGPLTGPVADQWSLKVLQQPFGNVRAIDVVPGGVFYATNESGVWFSSGFLHWERRAAAPPGAPATVPGITPSPSGPVRVSSVGSLSFVNANLGFGVAGGTVVRSDDGGRTWRRVGGLGLDTQDLSGGPRASGVYFANALDGVLWGGGPLQTTSDGGKTWTVPNAILSDNQLGWSGGRLWSFAPCAVGEQCDALPLEISDDTGKTWRETAPLRRGLGGSDLLVTSRTTAYVVQGVPTKDSNQPGPWQLALTHDGGATWTYEAVPCPRFTQTPSLAFNGRVLMLSCISGPAGDTSLIAIFTSSDDGRHWTPSARAGGESALLTSMGTTFVLQTGRTGLESSVDDGRSWQRAFSADFGPGLSAPLPGVGIWAWIFNESAHDNGIWFSADGVHWAKRSPGTAS